MIEKTDFRFPDADQNRRLHIWLPDDYHESGDRYPVMYMFDGHNLFYDEDATYGKSWGMKSFLERWDKKIIVVGLECSHTGNDRLREYCPYFWDSFAGPVYGTGRRTMEWIVREIKPFIDRTYRTWKHREATGIGGSSMGGLMALYAVTRFNDVFSKAACVSSAIGFCGRELRADIDQSDIDPDTKVFLGWGTEESRSVSAKAAADASNKAVNDRLFRKGAQPYMYRQAGGRHCEADWEKQVPLFMNLLWLNRI